jgi:hypothetical protein
MGINKRIIQEYGIQEANKLGLLDTQRQKKVKSKQEKLKRKKEPKNITGILYEQNLRQFLENGGDLNECPFD